MKYVAGTIPIKGKEFKGYSALTLKLLHLGSMRSAFLSDFSRRRCKTLLKTGSKQAGQKDEMQAI